jgi:hypothetical protein
MSTGLSTMATKKRLSVKLDEDVIASARLISALTGEEQQALLGRILRPVLQKMEEEALAKRVKAGPQSVKRPKGSE